MNILTEILEHKRGEVAEAKRKLSAEALAEQAARVSRPVRSLRAALLEGEPPRVIAEIKRRSPSKGEIRADFDPVAIATSYAGAGAAALSVLTDEKYFGGSLDVLRQVRAAVALPLLRKEFVLDAYQLDEARLAGADAALLIVAALSPEALGSLHAHGQALGLDVLVEVKDAEELEVALAIGADLIGINNRDLRTFDVDLATTEALAPKVGGKGVVVAESGIHVPEDIARLTAAGARGFLVGESLMRKPDPGQALAELRGTA